MGPMGGSRVRSVLGQNPGQSPCWSRASSVTWRSGWGCLGWTDSRHQDCKIHPKGRPQASESVALVRVCKEEQELIEI